MAASILKTWLVGAAASVRWIEFDAYAHRVFANAAADWHRDPTRFAAALIQAQGVIPTQCLTVDVLAPFLAGRPPGARTSGDLIERLAAAPPAAFATQAMNALVHRFDNRLDLVLALRSPRDLLASADPDAAPSFDDLDEVATALVSFMRAFADKPLAGVLLDYAGDLPLSTDDIDAYEPIISAARHYGWVTAMSLPALRTGSIVRPDLDLDLVLLPQMSLTALDAAVPGARVGGGLTDEVWAGASLPPAHAGARLLYGRVPATATPETVLAAVRALPS